MKYEAIVKSAARWSFIQDFPFSATTKTSTPAGIATQTTSPFPQVAAGHSETRNGEAFIAAPQAQLKAEVQREYWHSRPPVVKKKRIIHGYIPFCNEYGIAEESTISSPTDVQARIHVQTHSLHTHPLRRLPLLCDHCVPAGRPLTTSASASSS